MKILFLLILINSLQFGKTPAKQQEPVEEETLPELPEVITPENVQEMIQEELKYFEIETVIENGEIIHRQNDIIIFTIKNIPHQDNIEFFLEYFFGNYFSQRIITRQDVQKGVFQLTIKKSLYRFCSMYIQSNFKLNSFKGFENLQPKGQKINLVQKIELNEQIQQVNEHNNNFSLSENNIIEYTIPDPGTQIGDTSIISYIIDSKKQIQPNGENYYNERIFLIIIKSAYFQKTFYSNLITQLVVADMWYDAVEWYQKYVVNEYNSLKKIPQMTTHNTSDSMNSQAYMQYLNFLQTQFIQQFPLLDQIENESGKISFKNKTDEKIKHILKIIFFQDKDLLKVQIQFFNEQQQQTFDIIRGFLLVSMYNEWNLIQNYILYYYTFVNTYFHREEYQTTKSQFFFNYFDHNYYLRLEPRNEIEIFNGMSVDQYALTMKKQLLFYYNKNLDILYFAWTEKTNDNESQFKEFEMVEVKDDGKNTNQDQNDEIQNDLNGGFKIVKSFMIQKAIAFQPEDEKEIDRRVII